MERKRVYIDMDGVLCDFMKMKREKRAANPAMPFPQAQLTFWTDLEPIDGAIEAYRRLKENFDVYILTTPSIYNSASYQGKRIWVENHLGFDEVENLILSCHKNFLIGDYLIDDAEMNGQPDFQGEWIFYNPDEIGRGQWERVVQYIEKKENIKGWERLLI